MRLTPAVVDFIERVGATAFEAGAAVYIADPKAGTAKAAGIAALIAAVKYAYLKVGAWQAASTTPKIARADAAAMFTRTSAPTLRGGVVVPPNVVGGK